MSDTTTPATPPSGGEISDAAFDSNSWDEPSGTNAEQDSIDAWADETWDDLEEDTSAAESNADDVEAGDAKQHIAKATDDVQDIAKEATKKAKPDPEPEKTQPEKRQYKVKLDGEERELDPSKLSRALGMSEAGLAQLEPGAAEKLYQKLWHAEQKQNAGAQAIKQFEQFLGNIKGNPEAAIEQLLKHPSINLELKEVATQYLARMFEQQSMPPEQRELIAAKRELEAIRRQQAEAQQQAQAQHAELQRQKWVAELRADIVGALDQHKIPTHPRNLNRIVELMKRERDERGPDSSLPPSRAAELVPALLSEIQQDFAAYTGEMGGKALVDFIGQDAAKKINRYLLDVAKRGAAAVDADPTEAPVPQAPGKRRKRESFDDVLRDLSRR